MPKYKYICDQCQTPLIEHRNTEDRKNEQKCECGGLLQPQLPTVSEPSIMETADRVRNVQHRKDQDSRIRQRAKKYFMENEMDDLIAQHGEEQSKKFGWLDKEGKKRKKGDLS